jgi:hypothetical protein
VLRDPGLARTLAPAAALNPPPPPPPSHPHPHSSARVEGGAFVGAAVEGTRGGGVQGGGGPHFDSTPDDVEAPPAEAAHWTAGASSALPDQSAAGAAGDTTAGGLESIVGKP